MKKVESSIKTQSSKYDINGIEQTSQTNKSKSVSQKRTNDPEIVNSVIYKVLQPFKLQRYAKVLKKII